MFAEKTEYVLVARKMNKSQLAEKLGVTPQNLSNKLIKDNLKEADMLAIAEALNCKLTITLELNDSGKQF